MQKVITVEHIQRNGTTSVIEQRVTEYPPVVKMIEEGWRALTRAISVLMDGRRVV